MIAAAVLLLGLLLVVAGFLPGRVPGGAIFASPGSGVGEAAATGWPAAATTASARGRRAALAFAFSPVHAATWHATGAILAGALAELVVFSVLVGIFSAGSALLVVGIGIIPIVISVEGARAFVRFERRRAMRADPRPLIPHAYRPVRGGIVAMLLGVFGDVNRWRDVLYLVINLPLIMIEFAVVTTVWVAALVLVTMPIWFVGSGVSAVPAVGPALAANSGVAVTAGTVLGLLLLPVAATLSQVLMALHRAVVAGLICTSESRALQERVEVLRESRSRVLDVEASELRRIERDLHDGAQQRLVRLTIDLSLAADRIESDPGGARQLVLDSREQARQALAEIRDLVRGIAPAILLDRGLEAALGSLAGRSTVPAAVVSSLPPGQRLPDAVERAAYFVVAEALVNVARHSGATRCEVHCRVEANRLVVEVRDDGTGGAQARPGGGLAGLAGRVEALDGRLDVTSPPGGPTVLRAEIPVSEWRPPWWVGAAP